MIFSLLKIKILGKMLILMFGWSIQRISRMNSQSKSQMLRYIPAAMFVYHWGTGLCKFAHNISANI